MSQERSGSRNVSKVTRRRFKRIERVLRRAQLDEYIIVEHKQRRVEVGQRSLRTVHAADQRQLEVTLYRDLRRGRASASFIVTDVEDINAIDTLVAAAAARASHGLGPEWRLPAPAAPARVDLADSAIVGDPEGVAMASMEQLLRPQSQQTRPWKPTDVRVVARARETTVLTSTGFVRTKTESFLELDAVLRAQAVAHQIHHRARRREDLNIEALLDTAAVRLRDRAAAKPVTAGRYDLALELDAIVGATGAEHTGPKRYAWFASFVAQANAETQRRGLARYSTGKSVYGSRTVRGDKLTLTSDGTLARGWYSSPFSNMGEAIRSFPLINKGVAAQPSLSLREAGLRKQLSNGGVRNLVVAPGRRPMAALLLPGKRPLLKVSELASLDMDPLTGEFSAQLALGYLQAGSKSVPVTGGFIRGNLFDLFADVIMARETGFHTWYAGPRLLRFGNVAVH